MHPDQIVFLHPEAARQEESRYVNVGRDTYPDVVLEVDDTTDVRRAKLRHYEEWGFPEVWVDVPDRNGAPRNLRAAVRAAHLPADRREVRSVGDEPGVFRAGGRRRSTGR